MSNEEAVEIVEKWQEKVRKPSNIDKYAKDYADRILEKVKNDLEDV